MKRLKIAIWHNLPSGGGKRALYQHIRGLRERGHTVEVWCPPTADRRYLPLEPLAPEHVVDLQWRSIAGGDPVSTFRAFYHNLMAMREHCKRCAEEINKGQFDLLLAGACMFYAAAPIGRYVRLPRVLYLQEPYRKLYEASPRLPWLALPSPGKMWWRPRFLAQFVRDFVKVQTMRVQAREEYLSAQAFDVILVNSYFSRESVLRTYGLDAQVCYLGVDTDLFRNQRVQRADFVVGVGALVPEKNVEFVLESVARLPLPRPPVVWVGNYAYPPYVEKLREMARSSQIELRIMIRLDDRDLVDLLNRAAVMAYAPRLEPFGLAPLEASACGTPVVAVAEGGVRETIVDGVNGLLVENDPEAMKSAIDRLRRDPAYARKLGEQGRRMVMERWSLQSAIDHLEARLASALACGQGN